MNITGRMKVKGVPVQGVHMAELVDRALEKGRASADEPRADLRPGHAEPRSRLRDDFLRSAVRFTVDKLRGSKAISTEALGSWEDWREQGRTIRAHTIDNLDHYLESSPRMRAPAVLTCTLRQTPRRLAPWWSMS